ncbi:16S rRNA (guanine(966)-N(2))-methyltransferase RsmD [Guyparkeria hydrothermalis]|uniref:16S rRNA (guanine(966)-N(2))-methyltransferase RsmD n=1 Tax=Guyparkeria hydrothermalis TaxID=923 RepID=UPI0020205BF7|nr:16S rRNA (guanine(966)-N(2))-methyltransferase RsmD [Guyparkeria hydrothermalis]MCL7751535.1 16S rRNA (guanine(966)-N(2))-methyltransferase RsmD [Guyparkeria hydrothermalis]
MPSTPKGRSPARGEQVRIIGGEWRSRRLRFPPARDLRPTPDRVRETLFNWLGQDLAGWRVLDLFAGSGVLGIEALSRGAAWVGFVERSARVARSLEENLARLDAPAERFTIWAMNARHWWSSPPQRFEGPIDLVFLDPPFRQPELLQEALEALAEAPWLAEDARVFVESGAPESLRLPERFVVSRETRAGESRSLLLERAG